MIDRLIMLAAGGGARLREDAAAPPKPLTLVGGIPLCVRVLLGARRIGVRRVDVVIGFRGAEIKQALSGPWRVEGLTLRFQENPRWAETSNGVSLLAAAKDTSPFYLSMADHLFDEALWEHAREAEAPAGGATLLIDRNISRCFDLDDATKVRTSGRRIIAIGKDLTEYDALDCGLFAATSGVFDALREEEAERGDCSLSDGMRRLASKGLFFAREVGDAFWHDVDTPEALAFAEKILSPAAAQRRCMSAEGDSVFTK